MATKTRPRRKTVRLSFDEYMRIVNALHDNERYWREAADMERKANDDGCPNALARYEAYADEAAQVRKKIAQCDVVTIGKPGD